MSKTFAEEQREESRRLALQMVYHQNKGKVFTMEEAAKLCRHVERIINGQD